MYIYQACKEDKRYIPPKITIIKEFPTEEETINFLKENGGIYRNLLHCFECIIEKE